MDVFCDVIYEELTDGKTPEEIEHIDRLLVPPKVHELQTPDAKAERRAKLREFASRY